MGDDTILAFKPSFQGRDQVTYSRLVDAYSEIGLTASSDVDKVHSFKSGDERIVISFLSRFTVLTDDYTLNCVPLILKTLTKMWSPEKRTLWEELVDTLRVVDSEGRKRRPYPNQVKTMKNEVMRAHSLIWFSRLLNIDPIPDPWYTRLVIFFTTNIPGALKPSLFGSDIALAREIFQQIGSFAGMQLVGEASPFSGLATTKLWGELVQLERNGLLHAPNYPETILIEGVSVEELAKRTERCKATRDHVAILNELLEDLALAVDNGELTEEQALQTLDKVPQKLLREMKRA